MEQSQKITKLENDMIEVKTRLAVAEATITDIKEDISTIKDDTRWLRRAITNALIGLIVTGVTALLFTIK